MTTCKGTIKKTPLSDYANIRTNGLIAIKLEDGDELRWIKQTSGNNDILISTSAGQAIRFPESEVRSMGRSARGVRGVRLRPNDVVVGMDVVDDTQKVLVVSEQGYGKMTKISNFPAHKRGGVGIKAAAVTGKTGSIVSVQTVDASVDEVLLISLNGQTIRVAVQDVPTLGRTTQGVRIMRVADDDRVASVGLLSHDAEEETKK